MLPTAPTLSPELKQAQQLAATAQVFAIIALAPSEVRDGSP